MKAVMDSRIKMDLAALEEQAERRREIRREAINNALARIGGFFRRIFHGIMTGGGMRI